MVTDFVVIGSGLAGLTSALVLKDFGEVLIITKGRLTDSSTNLAQGGIAAVTGINDSFLSHIEDTLVAGAGHNDRQAVKFLIEQAPIAIRWLEDQGVIFDKKGDDFDFGQEAAHSHKRVIHATDFTGREIEKALVNAVIKEKLISFRENCFAVELLTDKGKCIGVSFISGGKIIQYFSRAVILATGGLGQLYQWTTNPAVATGDGVAMAYRVGAKISDLEFVQFHPTALKSAKSPLFLLSEALRGEGGFLVKVPIQSLQVPLPQGSPIRLSASWRIAQGHPWGDSRLPAKRFMDDYDERGELAPRDIVARAIFEEQRKGFEIFLDIRHKGKEFLIKRFPNIFRELEKRGFNLAGDLIPVTPAAHYSCGGVKVDLYGRTTVPNLFAFGEVCSSGVHGANRLASNSLLEAVVFPLQLHKSLFRESPVIPTEARYQTVPGEVEGSRTNVRSRIRERFLDYARNDNINVNLSDIKHRLQKIMWEKVGIVRRHNELKEALREIKNLDEKLSERNLINKEALEIKNMLICARLITEAALARKTSLGAHFVM